MDQKLLLFRVYNQIDKINPILNSPKLGPKKSS